jgi:hypothetical protein
MLVVLVPQAAHTQVKRYPKYSFGFGMAGGFGTLQEDLPGTAQLGLKADYQANPLPWLSLRVETGYTFFLKNTEGKRLVGFEDLFTPPVYYDYNLETTTNGGQFYLSFSPVFYYREGKLNLFAGFGAAGGIANLRWEQKLYDNITGSGPGVLSENQQDTYFTYGYFPFVGASYGLGKKRRPTGELELRLAYETWINSWDRNPMFFGKNVIDIRAITIQFTYRILLEK